MLYKFVYMFESISRVLKLLTRRFILFYIYMYYAIVHSRSYINPFMRGILYVHISKVGTCLLYKNFPTLSPGCVIHFFANYP